MIERDTLTAYLTILGGSAGRLVISLVYFLIVANTLSLDAFGLFAAASATGLILSRLLAFGFISPVYRVATVKPRLLGAYLAGFYALAAASLPLIGLAAAGIFALLFSGRMDAQAFVLIMLAEIACWRLVELVAIVNNGLNRFRQAALLVIIGSGLRTAAAIAFYLGGWSSLPAWSAAYLAATFGAAALALLAFMPRHTLRFVPRLYTRRMRDAVAAGTADVAFYVQAELDKLLMLALAGERVAGLYAIAIRVVDLTAMPVRSFNQMVVQKIMRERGLIGDGPRRAAVEAAIAAVSIAGLAAIILLLKPFPTALGHNVAEASWLLLPMLAVPAFRNLVEYHAELLYARERTGSRVLLLCGLTLVKAGLLSLAMTYALASGAWGAWLNAVFGAVYLVSAGVTYALLARDEPGGVRRAVAVA